MPLCRKKNRPLASLLVSVFIMCVLSACFQGNESSPSASSNPPQSGNAPSQSPKDDGPLKISFIFPLHAELPDLKNEYWTMLREKTNVEPDITWVPGADFINRMELMLTSGNIPEVVGGINPTNSTFDNAIRSGMFWDLTPFLGDFGKYPNLKKNAEEGVFDKSRINGNIYGIPRMRSATEFNIMMRIDWLEELNIPQPTTLDEYKEALKKIAAAKPGTVGLAISGVLGGTTDFPPAFGVYKPTYDDDGGLIRDILTPQYADMVEWFRGMYADGLLPKEFAAISGTQAEDLFSSGRAASYDRNIYRQWMYGEANRVHTPKAYVRSVELKGPEGYAIHLTPKYVDPMWISKKVPEDKVRKILDFFEQSASKEFATIGEYGFAGVHHHMVDGFPVMTELGSKQMNVTSYYHFALPYDQAFKARVPSAPPEWNKKTLEMIADWESKGAANQFNWLVSHKFNDIWPALRGEYETKVVQAVIGDIPMNEFRDYLAHLRNMPEMKKAFQEYAQAESAINQFK